MKILLLGVFDFGSTDVWKKLALERLGHRVVCHPYRSIPVTELFPLREPFDLVLVSKGTPLTAEDFAHLATLGERRHLWWPDPFGNWTPHHSEALRSGAWSVSATSHDVLRQIEAEAPVIGVRILEGADCEGPHVDMIPSEPVRALLHFGHLSQRRRHVIERLRADGVPVRVVERPVFGPALQRAVCRHAGVLSVNTSPDLYSNRVQTVLAMGGILLQEDAPDLVEDFPDVDALRVWDRYDDLRELARATLRDAEHAPVMPRVDQAREIHTTYRWEAAMDDLVAVLEEVPA